MNNITLAIDVMGGDKGPDMTIEGVSLAKELYPEVKFKLFGDRKKSESLIKKFNLKHLQKMSIYYMDQLVDSNP